MGSRPYLSRRDRNEETRKQRKERYIRAKNSMKDPICGYGDFYCDHYLDNREANMGPCVWADFRFMHTKLKRYFAVALITAERHALDVNEEKVDDELDKIYPYNGPGMIFHPINKKTGTGKIEFTAEHTATYNAREPLRKKLFADLNREAQKVSPKIDVKDYGPVAVGLWVTLNVPEINVNVIRDFVKFYRSLGEPITPGRVWTGEEIEIVPERLINEYAKSRSDC